MTTAELKTQRAQKAGHSRLAVFRMPALKDNWIHGSMLFLMVFGLLMIASASMGLAVDNPIYLPFTVIKQIVFLMLGYAGMSFFARRFRFSLLKSQSFPTLALGMDILLLVCLLFGEVNGARAWIRVPIASMDISIQPSEFAKIMTYLVIAAYCGDVRYHFRTDWQMVSRPLLFVASYIFIVLVLQSDMGSAAVIAIIACVCFLIPSNRQMRKLQRWILFFVVIVGVFAIFLLSPYGESLIDALPLKEYQKNRFLSAINPFADRYNTGYQLINGLVSFATGGWTGLGFGNSVRKYTDFPAANTDFILAIVVEELGFIGFLMIFIPYMIIICRLFTAALHMKSEKGRIILVGTAMYIVVHCLFNIGGVTGLIPLTGVPLLMISAGGSSTFSLMCAIGIAQAVIAAWKRGEFE